jgi:SNF2 family DNA or RNA helicase
MYEFKTTPISHQLEEFNTHWKDRARGLLWEMGTGKSKEALDQWGALYEDNEVDALIVVAPDGVHRNWVNEEIPKHVPDRILSKTRCFTYQTDKAATKQHQADCEAVLAHPGPIVVAMSYDAVVTEPLMGKEKSTGRRYTIWRGGKKFLWDLLRTRKAMYVADEARRIKNPTADRTKVVVKSAVYAPYRRLLNGTPVPNGPFDLYSQLKFLDEKFWEPHGISGYTAFKNMFGVFQKGYVRGPGGVMREFPQLLGYKNLDLLQRILGTICSRVTKEDVLNLPPKLYSRASFEITAAQRKVYDQLSEEFMAQLETGEYVSAPLAITRLLRFQQVTSGFLPVDDADGEPVRDIGTTNPRLDLLDTICEDIPHGCIIWARFNRTVDLILERLRKAKLSTVRYDGQVSADAREEAKIAFQEGKAQFFVAKQSTAGEGLTLTQAKTVIYVENTFDLAARLQSEDRAHRIGQEHPVNYIDMLALGTVDQHIVKCLVDKMDVANEITGDRVKQWLALK